MMHIVTSLFLLSYYCKLISSTVTFNGVWGDSNSQSTVSTNGFVDGLLEFPCSSTSVNVLKCSNGPQTILGCSLGCSSTGVSFTSCPSKKPAAAFGATSVGQKIYLCVSNALTTVDNWEIDFVSRAPTNSPSTSSPTKIPTTSTPTKSPSVSPSRSPSTSIPTKSPTKSPSTSKPSKSPTKSPSTSKPSKSPSKSPSVSFPTKSPSKSPTRSPSSSKPTRSPSTSPTRSPSTSKPTTAPSHSPTYICQIGTSSITGYGSGSDGGCPKCPAGGYESSLDVDRTSCENLPCRPEFWCGESAIEPLTYRQVMTHTDIDSTLVIGSSRVMNVEFHAIDGENCIISPLTLLDGVSFPSSITILSSGSTIVGFDINAAHLKLETNGQNYYNKTVLFQGRLQSDAVFTFTFELRIELNLVSVVVTPSSFDYSLDIGMDYIDISPSLQVDIFNPLCSSALTFKANFSSNKPWITFSNETATFGEIQPSQGTSENVKFVLLLSSYLEPANYLLPASYVSTFMHLELELVQLNVTLSREIPIRIRPLAPCPPGMHSTSGTNEIGCSMCSKGSFQPDSKSTSCLRSTPGYEASEDGTEEIPCPFGKYSSSITVGCIPCEVGTYADVLGSTVCKTCPELFPTTLQLGTTLRDQCVTDGFSNTFKLGNESKTCPVGTSCYFPGATVETLRVLPGSYRTTNKSLDIRSCLFPKFCNPLGQKNDDNSINANQSSLRRLLQEHSSNFSNPYCTVHHEGVLCERCEEGYYHQGPDRLCEECTGDRIFYGQQWVGGISFLLIFLLAVITFTVVFSTYQSRTNPKTSASSASNSGSSPSSAPPFTTIRLSSRIRQKCNLQFATSFLFNFFDWFGVETRITIGFFQVVSGFSIAFPDYLPTSFQALVRFFSLLSLDIPQLFSFDCVMSSNAFTSLLFSTLLPLSYYLCLFGSEQLVFFIKRNAWDDERRVIFSIGIWTTFFWSFFLLFPSISKTILKLFSLDTFDNGETYLQYDHQINCNTDAYINYLIYDCFMLVLYIIAIPGAILRTLYKQRVLLNPFPRMHPSISLEFREDSLEIQNTRMLWSAYNPRQYWFEIYELFRKLAQTSLFLFFTKEKSIQLLILLVTCALAIVMLHFYAPYVKKVHNALAQWTQWMIFAIAFCAFLNSRGFEEIAHRTAIDTACFLFLISVPISAFLVMIYNNRHKVKKRYPGAIKWLKTKCRQHRSNVDGTGLLDQVEDDEGSDNSQNAEEKQRSLDQKFRKLEIAIRAKGGEKKFVDKHLNIVYKVQNKLVDEILDFQLTMYTLQEDAASAGSFKKLKSQQIQSRSSSASSFASSLGLKHAPHQFIEQEGYFGTLSEENTNIERNF